MSLNQQKEETKMVQADDASVHESVDINWERKLSTRLAPCLLDFHAGNYIASWKCGHAIHSRMSPIRLTRSLRRAAATRSRLAEDPDC
jgi:hypothetical protein